MRHAHSSPCVGVHASAAAASGRDESGKLYDEEEEEEEDAEGDAEGDEEEDEEGEGDDEEDDDEEEDPAEKLNTGMGLITQLMEQKGPIVYVSDWLQLAVGADSELR